MESELREPAAPYHDVRALQRGLRILEVIGQLGWAKPTAISSQSGIDRSSTYRLLNTLVQAGYVVRRVEDGSFSLTARVKLLADGFTEADKLSQIAARHLEQLTAEISWPCDFAILAGGEAIIVESTHRLSPMSMHRAMIGKRRSLVNSALGRAILCSLKQQELDIVLNLVRQAGGTDALVAQDRTFLRQIFADYKACGYAGCNGAVDSKVSSIALPVRPQRSVVGAVNIIFFRSALTIAQAAERYIVPLRKCVDQIRTDLAAENISLDIAPFPAPAPASELPRGRDAQCAHQRTRGRVQATGSLRSTRRANNEAP